MMEVKIKFIFKNKKHCVEFIKKHKNNRKSLRLLGIYGSRKADYTINSDWDVVVIVKMCQFSQTDAYKLTKFDNNLGFEASYNSSPNLIKQYATSNKGLEARTIKPNGASSVIVYSKKNDKNKVCSGCTHFSENRYCYFCAIHNQNSISNNELNKYYCDYLFERDLLKNG